MAGHSKWHNIRHKKAKEDAKKGKLFTKLSKEITVATKCGGKDPDTNSRLRLLLDKAKEINMPKDNVVRAIKKGAGELEGVNYEPVTYEGYGPENIAVIVEALTDNKNRTAGDMRFAFSKFGGRLGEAVSWMFEKKGVIEVEGGNTTEDEIMEKMLEADLDDIKIFNDIVRIECKLENLDQVRKEAEKQNLKVKSAEFEWIAPNEIELSEEAKNKVADFLEKIDDLEDVQEVYSNAKWE